MNRMRDAAAWLEKQGHRENEIAAIESVLDFRLKAAAAAYRVPLNVENIEELFSLASASGSTELSDHVTIAIAATLDFCRATAPDQDRNRFLVSKLGDSKWDKPDTLNFQERRELEHLAASGTPQERVYFCPKYEFIVGLLCGYFSGGGTDRRDIIISLNYDTVVEDALSALGLPFRYADHEMIEWQPPHPWSDVERRPIPVLKLHGSVNLGERKTKDFGVQLLGYSSYLELRSAGLRPMLMAPTWQKSLTGYFSAIWREAVSALRTATRVIILGYSVPQTDQHFRYLLAAGLQENISLRRVLIVNPDISPEFKQRLSSLFRDEQSMLEIVQHVPCTITQFLAIPNAGFQIGRSLSHDAWKFG
jgi:SIR2-like protein